MNFENELKEIFAEVKNQEISENTKKTVAEMQEAKEKGIQPLANWVMMMVAE